MKYESSKMADIVLCHQITLIHVSLHQPRWFKLNKYNNKSNQNICINLPIRVGWKSLMTHIFSYFVIFQGLICTFFFTLVGETLIKVCVRLSRKHTLKSYLKHLKWSQFSDGLVLFRWRQCLVHLTFGFKYNQL